MGRRQHQLEDHIVDYFQTMFSTTNPHGSLSWLNALEGRVTIEMIGELLREFTKEEIVVALHLMHPTKALGPDEMPPLFF